MPEAEWFTVKISSVEKGPRDRMFSVVKRTTEKDFSSFMDMANRDKAEQYMEEMLEKIMQLSKKIKTNPLVHDIRKYKKHITDYLSFILKNYYRIHKEHGRYSLLLRVDVINKKIEELVCEFLEGQRDNIKLIRQVDEIQGLLLDLHC